MQWHTCHRWQWQWHKCDTFRCHGWTPVTFLPSQRFTCYTWRCHRWALVTPLGVTGEHLWHLWASQVLTCDMGYSQYTILHCDILEVFFYRRHERERGGLIKLNLMFFMWMISEKIKYEEPKETTLIDNVHVTRIYKFYPFCRDLCILLRDFRGVGPHYYGII